MNQLSALIMRRCGGAALIIGGDFNAHLEEFASEMDSRGKLLKEFALKHGLVILNTTDKCQGQHTRKDAVLDYLLCSNDCYELIDCMLVDDQRSVYSGSDHNIIMARLCVPASPPDQRGRRVTVVDTRRAAGEVVNRLSDETTPLAGYEGLKSAVHRATARCSRDITLGPQHLYRSKAVKRAVRERNRARRRVRRATRDGSRDVAILEQVAAACSVLAEKEKQRELVGRERRLHEWILRAPRAERAYRFWSYIRKHKRQQPPEVKIKTNQGEVVPATEMRRHLTEVAGELLNAIPKQRTEPIQRRIAEKTGITTTALEVKRVLGSMSTRTATGLDAIPAAVLKQLGDLGCEYLARLINGILAGDQDIPDDWGVGRVSLLEKPTSVKGDLTTYRPITISTVLYRVVAKILCSRMSAWMEENEILGEMQNGFRTGRRGDDNIFMLTSCIEMARKRDQGLVCAFLDASRAYDRVDRDKLWSILDDLGMNQAWIKMIRLLYLDNSVIVQRGEEVSERMETLEGLRQGCPMSPILFAMYISELELRLMKSGVGFKVQYRSLVEKRNFRIPGLLFADDLVLMGHTYGEMKTLLDITTRVGDKLGLTFNPAKSAVIEFAKGSSSTRCGLFIQGKELPLDHSYKYLGITLCDSPDYLKDQESIWEGKAAQALRQLHAQSLWTFNRYEISRIEWKAVAVPSLTYGNAVTTMSRRLRNALEVRQRDAARWALGIPGHKVATEFLDNELKWSTFEKREAQSKIKFFGRIGIMPQERWPRAVLTMMETLECKTDTYKRMKELKNVYRCSDIRVNLDWRGRPQMSQFNTRIEEMVTKISHEKLVEGMRGKGSLETYRAHIGAQERAACVYTNDRGSSLLALARAGMLPTRMHRRHYEPGIMTHCLRCGMEPETAEHVVLECNTALQGEAEFLNRLGLTQEINHAVIRRTKGLLAAWESETRNFR
jgi:Reverse transcriptase (RNA-dependent DNA polymerase)/Endonuclease-reverse transcriptase